MKGKQLKEKFVKKTNSQILKQRMRGRRRRRREKKNLKHGLENEKLFPEQTVENEESQKANCKFEKTNWKFKASENEFLKANTKKIGIANPIAAIVILLFHLNFPNKNF